MFKSDKVNELSNNLCIAQVTAKAKARSTLEVSVCKEDLKGKLYDFLFVVAKMWYIDISKRGRFCLGVF